MLLSLVESLLVKQSVKCSKLLSLLYCFDLSVAGATHCFGAFCFETGDWIVKTTVIAQVSAAPFDMTQTDYTERHGQDQDQEVEGN